jgi:hypothetical protein
MRGVLREALLRQGNELGPIVDPVGRQMELPFLPPLDEALEQVAIGAADVEYVAIVGDRIEHQFPFRAPPRVAATKSRLSDGIRLLHVRLLQGSETGEERTRQVSHGDAHRVVG